MSEPSTLQQATSKLVETAEQIKLGGGETWYRAPTPTWPAHGTRKNRKTR